jgi:catechol 2,3-dioxygenase-like lactoylglutathione lyase family enzyme
VDRSLDASHPPVWVGHVSLSVSKFPESLAFFQRLGMRTIVGHDTFAVLELRGGTHLVLRADDDAAPVELYFDLMVEDLGGLRKSLVADGFEPTPIDEGRIHSSFRVVEPSGHTVRFNDSHIVGVV